MKSYFRINKNDVVGGKERWSQALRQRNLRHTQKTKKIDRFQRL